MFQVQINNQKRVEKDICEKGRGKMKSTSKKWKWEKIDIEEKINLVEKEPLAN